MADRFPSLDEIDAGQTDVKGGDAGFDALESSGPSDFLSRERAILGDDADQFNSPADNTATVQDGDDDDLLGGDFQDAPMQYNDNNNAMDMGDFESSFPSIDTSNEAVAPGGTITGSALPLNPAYQASYEEEQEPDVVREWRERRDMGIAHRDEVSSNRKAETVKAAQQAIDDFYENYNNKKDKTISQSRKEADEFVKNREDTTAGGTSWERIAKLVDLSGKGVGGGAQGTGKAKFRETLLSLRKDDKAPGATGY